MEGVYYAYESGPMSSARWRARTGHSEQMAFMCAAAALESGGRTILRRVFLATPLELDDASTMVVVSATMVAVGSRGGRFGRKARRKSAATGVCESELFVP